MMARTLQPRSTTRPGAGRQALRRPTVAAASEPHEHQIQAPPAPAQLHRRAWLAAAAAAALAPLPPAARAEEQAPAVEILADAPGSGTARARQGDLVLVHYVGTVAGSGALFDSTRGGQKYRDGGNGVLRPVILQLGGSPVPGICSGLQAGIAGMAVGGRRTFTVPPALGFGGQTVLGPYGVVPGGSTVQYEVELLRLSRRGPDALMSGVSQCGGGFVNERTTGSRHPATAQPPAHLVACRAAMDGPPSLSAAPHTGTTIVAVSYADGVVIGADSRVSTGTYVSNRASDKITALCDNVYLLRSGSAADTQAVADYVRYFTEQHEMQLQRTPGVWAVANMVKEMNYQYKHLVYGCPIGGTIVREQWATDGSGSTFLWGFLDSEYKEGMSRQQAEDLVATALALAMSRDGSSGGVIRLVTISKDGAERRMITPEQQPVFWDEIPAPVGMLV
ncbi:hypothetical protein COHA_004869 [Chlorella ohadii]|uniref:peptidylprolyl isomerase n=1 Tax=Chlorella ohadii TaxID=2649997 RepID=A0AAD5H5Z3_9CHLO|nr:hypothetical protein COHA_004869 [Chlorella ohadii]